MSNRNYLFGPYVLDSLPNNLLYLSQSCPHCKKDCIHGTTKVRLQLSLTNLYVKGGNMFFTSLTVRKAQCKSTKAYSQNKENCITMPLYYSFRFNYIKIHFLAPNYKVKKVNNDFGPLHYT